MTGKTRIGEKPIPDFEIYLNYTQTLFFFFCMARQPYMGLGLLVSSRFHDHTHLRHTTLGRTPLDEWSARCTDLYLTTHNTHNRQTSMPPVGFEPTIPVSERPKTHALDRTATWTRLGYHILRNVKRNYWTLKLWLYASVKK
jgi:hypothetical protein